MGFGANRWTVLAGISYDSCGLCPDTDNLSQTFAHALINRHGDSLSDFERRDHGICNRIVKFTGRR